VLQKKFVGRGGIRVIAALALAISCLAPFVPAGAAHQLPAAHPEVPGGVAGAERHAAAEALDRWDVPAARESLGRLGPPREPADQLLASRIAFYAGEYAEAVRLLGLLPPDVAAMEPVVEYARLAAATQALSGRLSVLESEHFSLRFDPERDWVLAEPALEALEAGYGAIGEWLGARTPLRVRVEIVPSAEDFERVSGLGRHEIETAGAVGVSAFNKIMVLSPRLLLRGYPWRDAINHEYLHFLLVRQSANRAPIWLQEGIARYAETRWRSPRPEFLDDVDRSLLARALRENQLIPFSSMDPSLVRLPSPGAVRLAFAECALAIDYLLERWQMEGLRRVLAELARTPSYQGMDPVLRAAIGEPFASFEDGWRQSLEQRGYTEVAGVTVPEYHLAGGGDADAWDLADWQPLAAQNHLRLGDLLRARGNTRAALVEYERARTVAPGSPYVLVKTARALLELKRAEPAATAARAAVRLGSGYPAASVTLATAAAALGDHEEAAAALRAALEINPFDPFAWRDLGRALRKLGRAQEAQRASVTALRLTPGNQAFHRTVMEND
jgi:tetratricopeptide (TPR) repeat protein